MKIVFETNRLVFSEFSTTDWPLIFQLNKDPVVTRHTHDLLSTEEQARQVLTNSILPQYRLYQYGRWAVYIKEGNTFIGWCGLKFRPERKETDLGYRFMQAWWGKGYATEAAKACITYGFEQLQLPFLTAWAEPANAASIKVLTNAGLHKTGEGLVDGHPAISFRINNPLIP